MPKPVRKAQQTKVAPTPAAPMVEVDSYLLGLYAAFASQFKEYVELTRQLLHLEARVDMAEKNLRLTRDHLGMSVEKAGGMATPREWAKGLMQVRFVGMRLADACVEVLRAKKRLTPRELLDDLNHGMFRFRTSAPLREIHGALLRHPSVIRDGEHWVWSGEGDQLKLRILRTPARPIQTEGEEPKRG